VAIVKDGTYCGEDFGDDPAPEEDLDYLAPATDGCLDETGQPAKCFGPGTAHCCRDRRDAKGSGHLPTDIQHTLTAKNEIGSRTKFRRNLGQR
jgi:hypothetical protein